MEGGGDYLVHIVILVSGETTEKGDVVFCCSESSVAGIEGFGIGSRNWIIRFCAGGEIFGVFFHDGRYGRALTGSVFDFYDAGERIFVWIVHLHGGLEILHLMGFSLEAKGTIRECAKLMVEILVDGAGINKMSVVNFLVEIAEICIEEEVDMGVGKHILDEAGVATLGERLEFLGEVAVVPIGADGDASTNGTIKVARMAFPLFEGIIFKKLLVELGADLGNNDFFGVFWMLEGDFPLFEGGGHFFGGGGTAEELFKGIEIDGELPEALVGEGEDFVIDGVPLGELAEVGMHFFGVCAEVMGTVGMKENIGLWVIFIVGIACDVGASVEDEHTIASRC